MANEKRLIDANELYNEIEEEYDLYYGEIVTNPRRFAEMVEDAPTVDAVEVEDPELLKAIKLLIKQYARSKASDYVHSPVAHALYHTWKQVDERRKDA